MRIWIEVCTADIFETEPAMIAPIEMTIIRSYLAPWSVRKLC